LFLELAISNREDTGQSPAPVGKKGAAGYYYFGCFLESETSNRQDTGRSPAPVVKKRLLDIIVLDGF